MSEVLEAQVGEQVRRWKPYPAYKLSDVEWRGEIPEHWSVFRLGVLVDVRPSSVDKVSLDGEEPVSLCNYTDVYKNRRIDSSLPFMRGSATAQEIERFTLRRGDVLITKDSETWTDIGVPAVVAEDLPNVVCGYHLALLRPDDSRVDGRFLAYALQGHEARHQLSASASGITRFAVGVRDIKDVRLPIPDVESQRLIADFLDRETAKIDALIAKKEDLIRLLREKREALVEDFVFGSSVEKAVSWPLLRNKAVVFEVDEPASGDEELLTVSHLTGVTPRSEKRVYMFMAESFEGYKHCEAGDLVINTMWAWMGALGIARQTGMISPSYNVYRLRDPDRFDLRYLDSLFRTPRYISMMNVRSKGVWRSRLRLYPDVFLDMSIPAPSLEEQEAIVGSIAEEVGHIDELERALVNSVTTLREHRAALVSAAVTGKIDVREAV